MLRVLARPGGTPSGLRVPITAPPTDVDTSDPGLDRNGAAVDTSWCCLRGLCVPAFALLAGTRSVRLRLQLRLRLRLRLPSCWCLIRPECHLSGSRCECLLSKMAVVCLRVSV